MTTHFDQLSDAEIEEMAAAAAGLHEDYSNETYIPDEAADARFELQERITATMAYGSEEALGDMDPSLTPEQKAVAQNLSGPIAVVAGPGAGKTKTLVERVVNAVRQGTHPGRILAVTFTRKAANEMRERLAATMGEFRASSVLTTTFHGLSGQILRAECRHIGMTPDFEVLTGSEQKKLVKDLVKQYNLKTDIDYLSNVSAAKRNIELGTTSERKQWLLKECEDEDVAELFHAYEQEKKRLGRIDYDDMVMLAHTLIEKEDVHSRWASRYDHVLVDEYQDTDGLQHSLVKYISSQADSLMVVGDIDQSIFCQPANTPVTTPTGSKELGQLQKGDLVTSWDGTTVTHRPVAAVTTENYTGSMVSAFTQNTYTSYTPNHHCVTKINPAHGHLTAVVALESPEGFRVRTTPLSTRGAFGPQHLAACSNADRYWVLAVTTAVRAQHGALEIANHWNITALDEHAPTALTEDQAVAFLTTYGRLLSAPLWTIGQEPIKLDVPFVTAAANLMSGFQFFELASYQWTACSVGRYWFDGQITSMEVEEDHTYFGGGVLTHNSWRGSLPEIFASFSLDFEDAEVMYLNDNFRSTPQILDVARATISKIEVPFRSELRANRSSGKLPQVDVANDQHEEARLVTTWIRNLLNRGVPHDEIAVLYRGRRASTLLQAEMGRQRLPMKLSGAVGFYERKTIKDLLSWFRLAVKNDEMSFLRIIDQTPGLGPTAAREILSAAESETDGAIVDYLEHYVMNFTAMGKGHLKKVQAVSEIVDKITGLREVLDTQGITQALAYAAKCIPDEVLRKDEIPSDEVLEMLEILCEDASTFQPDNPLPVDSANLVYHYVHGEGVMLEPENGTACVQFASLGDSHPGLNFSTEDTAEDGEPILPVAAQVLTLYSDAPVPPPIEFLQQVSVDNQALVEAAGGAVELSTIHAAKGREWDHVAIIGMVDGVFPMGFDAKEGLINPSAEDRRTMFVAESRPRKSLYMTFYKMHRTKMGEMRFRYPSKFLYELEAAGVADFERKLPPPPKPRGAGFRPNSSFGGGRFGAW